MKVRIIKIPKTYQLGGNTPEQPSVPMENANAETEQGEIIQQQDGNIVKTPETDPTHEDGGSPQANVDRVLEDTGDKRNDKVSKLLRVKPKEVKAMFGFKPKGDLTHSKLYEKVVARDAKEINKTEKQIAKNLEYAKNGGGIYAQNSLEENVKFLMTSIIPQARFDQIYDHQEATKQMHDIGDDGQQAKTGGMKLKIGKKGKEVPVYQIGGKRDRMVGKMPPYTSTWNNYHDSTQNQQYTAPSWITPDQFYSTPGVIEYMNSLNNIKGYDNDLNKADDATWGYRHQAALEKFFPNGKPNPTVPTSDNVNLTTTPNNNFNLIPSANNTVPVGTAKNYTLLEETQASTVNEGLGWSGGYGNVLGLVNSFGRIPVGLEQFDNQNIRLHQEDVRPVINANQSDYNAALETLPANGVGYANQANLQGQKYRTDNNAVAAVETRNKAKQDQETLINSQYNAQIDQANLGLRDQFTNRVLLGKEKQRQQKFEYINGLFKAIDERNAFNRNANLALQLTPFFDANGKFNGNKYNIASNYTANNGENVQYIEDKQTGDRFRVIYDQNGKLISSSKVIKDNSSAQTFKIPLK